MFKKEVVFGVLSAFLINMGPMNAHAQNIEDTSIDIFKALENLKITPPETTISPQMEIITNKENLLSHDIAWDDINTLARGEWNAEKRDQLEILMNKQIALDPDLKNNTLFLMPGDDDTFDTKKMDAIDRLEDIFPGIETPGYINISDASQRIYALNPGMASLHEADNGRLFQLATGYDDAMSYYRERGAKDNFDYLEKIDPSFIHAFFALHEYVHSAHTEDMAWQYDDLYQSMGDRLNGEERADFLAAAILTVMMDDKDYVREQLSHLAEIRTTMGLNVAIEHTHDSNTFGMVLSHDHNTTSGLLAMTNNWDDFKALSATMFPDNDSLNAKNIKASMAVIDAWYKNTAPAFAPIYEDSGYANYRGFIDAKNYIMNHDKNAVMSDNPYFHQYLQHYMETRDERGNSDTKLSENYVQDFPDIGNKINISVTPAALTPSDQL